MPIERMHLYAAKNLASVYKIEDFDSFRLGTVFPDGMWYGIFQTHINAPKDVADLIERLHNPKIINGLRLPNWIEFSINFKSSIDNSDFYKGMLFHLILDYCNNSKWRKHVIIKGSGFILYSPYNDSNIVCENEAELLNYKYGDMQGFLSYREPVDKLVETNESKICAAELVGDSDVISEMVRNVNEIIDSKLSCYKGVTVFDDFYYNDIIEEAIRCYRYCMDMVILTH